MTPRRILVWGAGGHGQVVADVAEACGWEVAGFIARDVTQPIPRGAGAVASIADRQVRESLAQGTALPLGAVAIALGVGDNTTRLAIAALIAVDQIPALLHPSAVVSRSAVIGPGTVVMPRVVVNARAIIGRAVILNTAAVVEHDCRVEEGAHLSPGALLGGEVVVERLAWIGIGGVVIPRRTIGAGAVVGAGSTAHRDVASGATVVGNPARVVPGKGGGNAQ